MSPLFLFSMTYTIVTKEYILSKISQEDVFEYYLRVKVQFDYKICSPLRKDKNPTCSFQYSTSGVLYLRDFAGHFWGNCFDMVMHLYSLTYQESLLKIAGDFKLLDADSDAVRKDVESFSPRRIPPTRDYCKIGIRVRSYNDQDMRYWKSYGIGRRVLKMYGVYPCESVFVNDRKIYGYSSSNPAYAYRFGEGKYKIYFPYHDRSTFRFISNTTEVQGYAQLPEKGSLLVITKAMKDVMLLRQWNISAIAPQSEVSIVDSDLIREMRSRFETIVLIYDFDYAGIKSANKIRRKYGLPVLFLTNGKYGTEDFGAKDLTDYYKSKGASEFGALLQRGYQYGIKSSRNPGFYQTGDLEQRQESPVLHEG